MKIEATKANGTQNHFLILYSNNKNLNTNSNLYSDARHLNKLGNKILAEKINNFLLNHYHKKDLKSY